MPLESRRSRRTALAVVASAALVALAAAPVDSPASHAAPARAAQAAAPGPFATLLFSRTEITAADNCVANSTNIARLDTKVMPWLRSLGIRATGTLATATTRANSMTCTHFNSSLMASWAQATSLATNSGWSFVSHTATYPSNLAGLTAAQSQAETCGSAETLEAHGLPGARGLIAYPGAQPSPTALQTDYGAKCFAWGRQPGSAGTTTSAAGTTAPYWMHSVSVNGGACNVSTAPCYTVPSTGSKRYQLPSKFIAWINAIGPGEWFTLQAYLLVTGKSPAYTTSPIRWDCTSSNVRMHWSNTNERYCYQDWQTVVRAIRAIPGVTITDPLTVGIAFGRPATYP